MPGNLFNSNLYGELRKCFYLLKQNVELAHDTLYKFCKFRDAGSRKQYGNMVMYSFKLAHAHYLLYVYMPGLTYVARPSFCLER